MARSETNRSKSSASVTEARKPAASRSRRAKPAAADDAPVAQSVAQATSAPTSTAPSASTSAASPAVGTSPGDATTAPVQTKRFDVFVIDVGWKSAVAEALRNNLGTCLRFQHNSTVYVLSAEQCTSFFQRHPSAIGTEPSIIIIDREAYAAKRRQGYGFKMNLGLIRDVPTANNLLKWVHAVLAEQQPGSDITEPIRTVLHKEGIRGAIDILADIAHSPVGEAMTH